MRKGPFINNLLAWKIEVDFENAELIKEKKTLLSFVNIFTSI